MAAPSDLPVAPSGKQQADLSEQRRAGEATGTSVMRR